MTATPTIDDRATRPPRRADRRTGATRLRGEGGSVAAEVAIAIPVLIAILVFVGILTARGVDARLRLDAAAHDAARAASLTRLPTAAQAAALQAATDSLHSAGVDCGDPSVSVDTDSFAAGGIVTVTVSCHLDLSDAAALLAISGSRTQSATASSPIDTYRGTTLGLAPPSTPGRARPVTAVTDA